RINTDGTGLTEFSVPSSGKPGHMSAGPGGNLYFLEAAQTQIGAVLSGLAKIGMITTTGSITEFAIPSGGLPRAITNGPDGNVWFTTANKEIGKLVPSFSDSFARPASSTQSGNTTINSAIVTGLTNTGLLATGMSVTGTGIPANTIIASINS